LRNRISRRRVPNQRVHRKHPRDLKNVNYVRVRAHVTSGHAWVTVGSAPRGTSGSGELIVLYFISGINN
jgi:hypothetical protein